MFCLKTIQNPHGEKLCYTDGMARIKSALILLITVLALLLFSCTQSEADKGIIGSADGPTLIYVSS